MMLKRRNELRRQRYDRYTDAASRSHRDTLSRQDTSSDMLWNYIILDAILDHHDHDHGRYQDHAPSYPQSESWSLPDFPSSTPSSSGSMDFGDIDFGSSSPDSGFNIDTDLGDLFRDVANGSSGIDFSPKPEPISPPSWSSSSSDSNWGSSSSSSSSDWGSSFGGGGMDSGGSMDL
ncbi:MAG: hypothetical protein LRY36_00040 [Alphaproteobacteria bacterium]|nr:hypothetical protein [Alphaproteobacteria bacterium]